MCDIKESKSNEMTGNEMVLYEDEMQSDKWNHERKYNLIQWNVIKK